MAGAAVSFYPASNEPCVPANFASSIPSDMQYVPLTADCSRRLGSALAVSSQLEAKIEKAILYSAVKEEPRMKTSG